MNLFGLSPGEIILIALVAMIVIGPEKLPETAASVGKWIREFRRVTQELTQQFADENPFTEIQRALAFNDEPQVVAAVPEPAPIETSNADFNVGHASADVHAGGVSASANGVGARPPRRSDYFDHPSYYNAIEDSWTHSGLDGYRSRTSGSESLRLPIADDWAHGVAVPIPPLELPSPAASDDVPVVDVDGVNGLEAVAAAGVDVIEVGFDDMPSSPVAVDLVSSEVTVEVAANPSEDVVAPIEDLRTTDIPSGDTPQNDEVHVESNGHVKSEGLPVLHPTPSSEPDRESPVVAGAGHTEEQRS